MKKTLALATCAGLLFGGAAAVPAQAKTVNACVKKKTGEVRIGKKCKKGWKKVTWNTKGNTGPQGQVGPVGADGPVTNVKDGTGKVLGRFMGLFPSGFNVMFVLVDGGLYTYLSDGRLIGIGSGSPYFTAADCSSTPFLTSNSDLTTQLLVGSAGGPTRIIWRKTSPVFGPAFAWAITTNTQVINQAKYRWDSAGACVADGSHNGTIVFLTPVTAPGDVPGPLTAG